jgi:hypothetical protein
MTTNDIVKVADIITLKKEIIDHIAAITQPHPQARFVNGKVISEVTGLKSYNSMMKHFGQFSSRIGGRRFFELDAVTQHLKEKQNN